MFRFLYSLIALQNPIEKKTRENIRSLAVREGTRHVDQLRKEIDKFHQLDLVDKGDLALGQDALDWKSDKRGGTCKIIY